jgi:hypothetical protein
VALSIEEFVVSFVSMIMKQTYGIPEKQPNPAMIIHSLAGINLIASSARFLRVK